MSKETYEVLKDISLGKVAPLVPVTDDIKKGSLDDEFKYIRHSHWATVFREKFL